MTVSLYLFISCLENSIVASLVSYRKSINVNEVDWHVKASPLAMTKAELTDLMACAAVPVTAITDKPRAALSLVLCRNT